MVRVVIPAYNEADALPKVLSGIPDWVDAVIVADNGSTDGTGDVARAHGATVVRVEEMGYGRACLAGVKAAGDCDILVFMDGDASDDPHDMASLVAPIRDGLADLVIGSRARGERERGSLTIQQQFGNALACQLIKMIWGHGFTDLGPFRAIRRSAYEQLDMQAPTFGWTVEMQVRALKHGLICAEVPAAYRKRLGTSKISGTVRGVVLAGYYILGTIGWEALRPVRTSRCPTPPNPPSRDKRLSSSAPSSAHG
ncbi:MAG: glycosyltransferase family 2 protein [Pseudomonadota bacterium]